MFFLFYIILLSIIIICINIKLSVKKFVLQIKLQLGNQPASDENFARDSAVNLQGGNIGCKLNQISNQGGT